MAINIIKEKCIGCGQCEGVCPQDLEIISLLKNVSEEFDQNL